MIFDVVQENPWSNGEMGCVYHVYHQISHSVHARLAYRTLVLLLSALLTVHGRRWYTRLSLQRLGFSWYTRYRSRGCLIFQAKRRTTWFFRGGTVRAGDS